MDWQKIAQDLKKNYSKKGERRLKDMEKDYFNQEEVNRILKNNNPIIYKTYTKDFDKDFFITLTVIKKGNVGKECYMTKGHIHQIPSKEYYILTRGKGVVLMEDKENSKVISLKKNKKIKVPENYAHRTINNGDEALEFLSIYKKNAGHDYSVKFRKRVLKNCISSI
ncbi:MAG: glucose-6-phosphate isomerase family protein [Candidatus Pacebacteria bacterium]|nr:glucose-6-phosphate isomerase family protein [Candidatus Paceibacterota bacterium]